VCAVAPGIDELGVGERADALSIGELYGEVGNALTTVFPRQRELWVRGEIQNLTEARSGHGYFDLVDPEGNHDRNTPVLKVNCWNSKWGPIKRSLAEEGIILEKGTVITLRGRLEFYAPRGQINLIAEEVDVTALLGRLAARRAELLRQLAAEGLLEANKAVPVAAVPLRVGLVGSPGTEGWRDFLSQLLGSGFAFDVLGVPTVVQGPEAARALASAIGALGRRDRQVIVVVRGGGSKADLGAFDTELVARAIAGSPVAVWTGIGHTGDESVADIVANRSHITPTECGRELALRVGLFWEGSVVGPAAWIARRASEVLGSAEHRDQVARGRLCATARHLLTLRAERLGAQADKVAHCAPRLVDDAGSTMALRAGRLVPLALGHVEQSAGRIGQWRRLLVAYDVDRQLERGYTLTMDTDGRALRSVAGIEPGTLLTTRFADGVARSVVDAINAGVEREEQEV